MKSLKKACDEIAPCFQSGNIEFVIRQAKDAEKVKSSAAQSLERMMDLKLRSIPGGNIELIEKLYIAFDELIMDEFRIAKEHEANKAEGEKKYGK